MPTYQHGMFIWRELMTEDDAPALRFYTELCGWKVQVQDVDNGKYNLLLTGDKQVGGIMKMPMPPTGGMPRAYWSSYLSVPDVDAVVAKAKERGGQIMWGPMDVPNVGRMAGIIDPQGAIVDVLKMAAGDQPFTTPKAGEFCWEQLNTTDMAAAKKFYGECFGLKTKPFDGGGGMEVFGIGSIGDGERTATLFQAPAGVPAHWLTYVVVDKLQSARERATRLGGKVLVEKIDVPGIGAYAVVQDPQGATIGLFHSA